jgi:uncharacterized protein (TIGR03435 family)
MRRRVAVVTWLLTIAGAAFGQSGSAPAFEVASVKVSEPPPPGVTIFRVGSLPDSTDPGRVTYRDVTIKQLAARAYGVKEYQVEGPEWLDGEHYDIIATIPQGSDKAQVGLMMQRLLAERFKLTVHHESKPMPVYTLSVAKGGPKLHEVDPATLPPPPPPGSMPLPPPPPPPGGGPIPAGKMPAGTMRLMIGLNNRHLAGNIPIEKLCSMLSNLTDRPVIDLTELKGIYAFDLSWIPGDSETVGGKFAPALAMARAGGDAPPGGSGQPGPESASDPGMTLVQALQSNYGLKLEAKKNPADILVIDHAEKVPTEN